MDKREYNIRVDKRELPPSVQTCKQESEGFFYEDLGEDQQEKDDWEEPDK